MDVKQQHLALGVVVMALWCACVAGMNLPHQGKDLQEHESAEEEKRATYLDTRELDTEFKDVIFTALTELVAEGRVNGNVLQGSQKEEQKRGNKPWQGVCFRKSVKGRYLPYICWKGGK